MTTGRISAVSALAGRSAPHPAARNARALVRHRGNPRPPDPLRLSVRPG